MLSRAARLSEELLAPLGCRRRHVQASRDRTGSASCWRARTPGSAEAFAVRAFFLVDGTTREGPVTGSLNAWLAEWLLGSGRAEAPCAARQGTALGRAGRVRIEVDDQARIWTGGGTVRRVRGEVSLD
jgi:predicted PhzF superfamily epimerase YddE/YHI9